MVKLLLGWTAAVLVVLSSRDVSAFVPTVGQMKAARAATTASTMQSNGIDKLCRVGLSIVGAAVLVGGPCFAEGRSGPEIFAQKCANCHKGGGNTVVGMITTHVPARCRFLAIALGGRLTSWHTMCRSGRLDAKGGCTCQIWI